MNKSLIIFGIVNITSDSFSDGGRYLAPDAAIAQARKLMAEGADVIDLGPASSNPDAAPVSSDTEIARIAPVLDALKADGIPVSLDSYQPATQAYALSRGVAYLNDIRGFPDAAFVLSAIGEIICQTRRYAFGARRAGRSARGTRWRHHGSHCGVL